MRAAAGGNQEPADAAEALVLEDEGVDIAHLRQRAVA
jgi:hypothetical protein